MEFLLWILAASMFAKTQAQGQPRVKSFHIKDNELAKPWDNITLQCEVENMNVGLNVNIYNSEYRDHRTDQTLANIGNCTNGDCISSSISPFFYDNCNITLYESGVEIFIPTLYRSEHQKWWHCILPDDESEKSMQLTIYTSPTEVNVTNMPPNSVDLATESGSLTCEMDCTYPSRSIIFYYIESGGDFTRYMYEPFGDTIRKPGGYLPCGDSWESILSSTLTLRAGTTFPLGNVDTTVRFKCGVTTFQHDVLYSELSPEFRFAVEVSNATLTSIDGYVSPESDRLVFLDVQLQTVFTFECVTGASRPSPTIVWYLDGYEVKRGVNDTRFDLEYSLADDGKVMVCMAFNVQPESDAVISNNLTLVTKAIPVTIPTNFRVDATAILYDSVTFVWSPIADSDVLVENCVIEYRTNEREAWQTRVVHRNASMVTVTGLIANTVYQFRIYTSNAFGESSKSDIISVKTASMPDQRSESGGSNVDGVIGGVIGASTAATVAVVIVVVVTLRRQNKLCFASSSNTNTTANQAKQDQITSKPSNETYAVHYTKPLNAGQVPDPNQENESSEDPGEHYYSSLGDKDVIDDEAEVTSDGYVEPVMRTSSERKNQNVDSAVAPYDTGRIRSEI